MHQSKHRIRLAIFNDLASSTWRMKASSGNTAQVSQAEEFVQTLEGESADLESTNNLEALESTVRDI